MSLLERAFTTGQHAAFLRFKIAAPATPPKAAVTPRATPSRVDPTTVTPQQVQGQAYMQDVVRSYTTPQRNVTASAEEICTTCRRPKHYGPCLKPRRSRPEGNPVKSADFNMGMTPDDAKTTDPPSTSPHYHSAVVADSALARARDGRPADEQAATGFADLFRHEGVTSLSDDAKNLVDNWRKCALDLDVHTTREHRGPSVDPYEERPTRLTPPVGGGLEGLDRIWQAFDQVDGAADATGIEGSSQPSEGPATLG